MRDQAGKIAERIVSHISGTDDNYVSSRSTPGEVTEKVRQAVKTTVKPGSKLKTHVKLKNQDWQEFEGLLKRPQDGTQFHELCSQLMSYSERDPTPPSPSPENGGLSRLLQPATSGS